MTILLLPIPYTYKSVNKLGEQEFVIRIEDNAWIPFDEANIDYQQYLAWLAEGNSPLPADE